MVDLDKKRWYFFLWDENNIDHIERHKVTPEEAEEVFFNKYIITPNKKKYGLKRYRVDGLTNKGRYLRVIFEDLGQNTARIITGWDL